MEVSTRATVRVPGHTDTNTAQENVFVGQIFVYDSIPLCNNKYQLLLAASGIAFQRVQAPVS